MIAEVQPIADRIFARAHQAVQERIAAQLHGALSMMLAIFVFILKRGVLRSGSFRSGCASAQPHVEIDFTCRLAPHTFATKRKAKDLEKQHRAL